MAWKKLVLAIVWIAALASWGALAAFYFTDPSLGAWAAAVTGVAVLTEIAFWTTAAVLGITLWEGRKAIWRFVTRPFRRKA